MRDRKLLTAIVSALVAALIAAITITVTIGGEHGHGLTVTFGGPHGTPTTTVEVPVGAVEAAKASDLDDHEKLRTENPAGVKPAALDAGREQQERLAQNDQLPIVTPDAAPEQRGCTTRLVQNFSSRRGVRPRVFVLHYTVSPNRAGWGDVLAVSSLFDRPAFSASSNYVIDAEGNCLYIVRESDKAWTQAAANPIAISAEVVNSGHEATYAGTKGLAKLGLVISDATKRWEIPLQRGAVSGCVVTRPGIVDHYSLGACGGGHFDIRPFSVETVLAAAKKARGVKPRPPALQACTIRNLQRKLGVSVDGVMGPKTRAAIRRLQTTHNLPATGLAGANVARLLRLARCPLPA